MLSDVGLADDLDGTGVACLVVRAFAHLAEGSFAEDAAHRVPLADHSRLFQTFEEAELQNFLDARAEEGRARVLRPVRSTSRYASELYRHRALLLINSCGRRRLFLDSAALRSMRLQVVDFELFDTSGGAAVEVIA